MTELNKKLFSACTDQFDGYDQIERLLSAGAEPLGLVINEYGEEDNLYSAVVDYYSMGEEYSELFGITKLFCQHRMDITKPAIPYDNSNVLNPVWHFTILMNDGVLPILKYLLDQGFDPGSAHICWYHAVEYWRYVDDSMEDEYNRNQVLSDLRKILLIASYPYVLKNDNYLQEIVWLDKNDYDIMKLRDWTSYSISVENSQCGKYLGVIKSLFTLTDKVTGREIWKLGFGLDRQGV